MICRSCLRKATLNPSALLPSSTRRALSHTPRPQNSTGNTPATSTSAAQPFSTPLSPTPNEVSLGAALRPKPKTSALPISSAPKGTVLKGINYIKGRDDPVALGEEEYPEWLWRVLDVKTDVEGGEVEEGDEFSKSKKLRRKAAKRQRKLEAQMLLSGNMEALAPKIPITKQSIDLPANEEGTVEGAMKAVEGREEVRKAMRGERRKGIKQGNYLKSM
ncbi:hypothetical protein GLAREA_05802 [Glarea lozoyensis ATCC 20868]|uniref:Large ribosomal subunit protein mL54 n=1 Tax=Glarea lozoyensis (strain ATCC 20868 / MF5171) TaxID=1116229 RepID=S3DH37_GLAL2|nr:uncharacterized protein GLAREA_05802 [Glarea lozoyensis ATCC 20868]EPE36464.1 hypothetical protein GLAREA_05802 [Glarea lozoyensis ATCC 20868]